MNPSLLSLEEGGGVGERRKDGPSKLMKETIDNSGLPFQFRFLYDQIGRFGHLCCCQVDDKYLSTIQKSESLVLTQDRHNELLDSTVDPTAESHQPESQHAVPICVEVVCISKLFPSLKKGEEYGDDDDGSGGGKDDICKGSIYRRLPFSKKDLGLMEEQLDTSEVETDETSDAAETETETDGEDTEDEDIENLTLEENLFLLKERSNQHESIEARKERMVITPINLKTCSKKSHSSGPCARCQIERLFQGEMAYFSSYGDLSTLFSSQDESGEDESRIDQLNHSLELRSLPFCVPIIAIIISSRFVFVLRESLGTQIDIHNHIEAWKDVQREQKRPGSCEEQPSSSQEQKYLKNLWLCYQLIMTSAHLGFSHEQNEKGSLQSLKQKQRWGVHKNWLKVANCVSTENRLVSSSLADNTLFDDSPQKKYPTPSVVPPSVWSLPCWIRSEGTQQATRYMMSAWCCGLISNYDYLLFLNFLAGRRVGDPEGHPLLPWICDFTTASPSVNRDFTKSKFRLTKGDHQLDYTFSQAEPPHHVTEPLTNLTYYIYTARRTPLTVLRTFVRSKFKSDEYPANMQKMYSTSPHEAIPEFYSDQNVFKSIHPELLADVILPSWAATPEEFIQIHQALLESPQVSGQLHHWIDLMFGWKLLGAPGVAAKNIPLLPDSSGPWVGYCRLFSHAHPQRISSFNLSQQKQPIPLHFLSKELILKGMREDLPLPLISQIHQCVTDITSFCESPVLFPKPSPSQQQSESGITEEKTTNEDQQTLIWNLIKILQLNSVDLAFRTPIQQGEQPKMIQGPHLSTFPPFSDGAHSLHPVSPSKPLSFENLETSSEKKKKNQTPLEKLCRIAERGPFESLISLLLDSSSFSSESEKLWTLFSIILNPLFRNATSPVSITTSLSRLNRGDSKDVQQAKGEGEEEKEGKEQQVEEDRQSTQEPQEEQAEVIEESFADAFLALVLGVKWTTPPFPHTFLSCETRGVMQLASQSFPSYFGDLYSFLFVYHSIRSWKEKARYCRQHLRSLLCYIPHDAIITFLVPLFIELLECENGQYSCGLLSVAEEMCAQIGSAKFEELILPTCLKLYEKTHLLSLQEQLLGASGVQFMWRVGGLSFLIRSVLPCMMDALKGPSTLLQSTTKTTLVILVPIMGPVVSLKFVVLPLLKSLWRPHTPALLSALEGIMVHFGEIIVTQVYLPVLISMIKRSSSLSSTKEFYALLSSLILLESVIDLMSPHDIVRRILCEHRQLFSSLLSPSTHVLIFCQLLSIVVKMARLIGPQATHKYLLSFISQYFSYFGYFYDSETGLAKDAVAMGPMIGTATPDQVAPVFDQQCSLWLSATFGDHDHSPPLDLPRLALTLRRERSGGQSGQEQEKNEGKSVVGWLQENDEETDETSSKVAALTTICSPEFASIIYREFSEMLGVDIMKSEISNYSDIIKVLNVYDVCDSVVTEDRPISPSTPPRPSNKSTFHVELLEKKLRTKYHNFKQPAKPEKEKGIPQRQQRNKSEPNVDIDHVFSLQRQEDRESENGANTGSGKKSSSPFLPSSQKGRKRSVELVKPPTNYEMAARPPPMSDMGPLSDAPGKIEKSPGLSADTPPSESPTGTNISSSSSSSSLPRSVSHEEWLPTSSVSSPFASHSYPTRPTSGGLWLPSFDFDASSNFEWERLHEIGKPSPIPITHIAHHNEFQFLTGSVDGSCRYYTLGQDDVNGRGLRCTSRITSADFLGGAMEGALVSDETAVRIWDYNQGVILRTYWGSSGNSRIGSSGEVFLSQSGGPSSVFNCATLSPHSESFVVSLSPGGFDGPPPPPPPVPLLSTRTGAELNVGDPIFPTPSSGEGALSFFAISPRVALIDPLAQRGPEGMFIIPRSIVGEKINCMYPLKEGSLVVIGGSNGRASILDLRTGGILVDWAVDRHGVKSICGAPLSRSQFLTLAGYSVKLWSFVGQTIQLLREFRLPPTITEQGLVSPQPTIRILADFISSQHSTPTAPSSIPLPLPSSLMCCEGLNSFVVLAKSYHASASLMAQDSLVHLHPKGLEGNFAPECGVYLPFLNLSLIGSSNGIVTILK